MAATTTQAVPTARRATLRSAVPTLRVERSMLRGGARWLAAVDEVGRGALAGPVTVGVVLVDLSVTSAPKGLRDSKLLTPEARTALAPRLRRWAPAHAVGHASAEEIDGFGILRALRMAGERALRQLPAEPDVVLLDGSYDWLNRPQPSNQPSLFDDEEPEEAPRPLPVTTMIKADLRCAGVAAASVLAKTERDGLMVGLSARFPAYGWAINKGYATPEHRDALRVHGACVQHRRSWNLLGEDGPPDAMELDEVIELGTVEREDGW